MKKSKFTDSQIGEKARRDGCGGNVVVSGIGRQPATFYKWRAIRPKRPANRTLNTRFLG